MYVDRFSYEELCDHTHNVRESLARPCPEDTDRDLVRDLYLLLEIQHKDLAVINLMEQAGSDLDSCLIDTIDDYDEQLDDLRNALSYPWLDTDSISPASCKQRAQEIIKTSPIHKDVRLNFEYEKINFLRRLGESSYILSYMTLVDDKHTSITCFDTAIHGMDMSNSDIEIATMSEFALDASGKIVSDKHGYLAFSLHQIQEIVLYGTRYTFF